MSAVPADGPDPFGTARIRRAVIAAWAALPSRFLEDLNTEQDYGAGSYRDRLLVELAQNAADAAGPPGGGVLRFELDIEGPRGPVLLAHNTGEPLTAAGVTALSSLRASRKGQEHVGRFGVGFTAVLSATDAPELHSRTGSVGFSRAATAAQVARVDELRDEVARAGGRVPVLRLPYPVEPIEVPPGFTTTVVLPLRDDAVEPVTAQLRDLIAHPQPLLLGLPGLDRLEVRLDDVRAEATLSGYLTVSDGPVTWAVPERDEPRPEAPGVLFAPTPTEEPVTLPALLVASVPLEPGRRHVVRGEPASDIARRAGAAYGSLLENLARAGRDIGPFLFEGTGQGWFDDAVRRSAHQETARRRLLPRAGRPDELIAPRHAVTLTNATDLTQEHWRILAAVEPDLVVAGGLARELRVRTVELDELVERLPANPSCWADRVAPLLDLTADPRRREDLATVGVPLVSGAVVRGARGVLLPEDDLPGDLPAAMAQVGRPLRVAHPAVVAAAADPAVRRGLERLGALPVDARTILRQDAIREVVREIASGAQDEEPTSAQVALCRALLDLVVRAWDENPWPPGELGWLREMLLPDDAGEWVPAWSLVQPGSVITRWLDPDDVQLLHPDEHSRLPPAGWRALGVADRPLVHRVGEIDPDAVDEELDEFDRIDDWIEWSVRRAADVVGEPVRVADGAVLVRDLDLLDPVGLAAWLLTPPAREVRDAIVRPTRWVGPDGAVDLPGHPAWWLGRRLGVAGAVTPTDRLAGVLPVIPAEVPTADPPLLSALGAVNRVADLPPSDVVSVLARVSEPTAAILLDLWAAAAGAGPGESPASAWALTAEGVPVRVAATEAVVVDAPQWLARPDLGHFVVAPGGAAERLADALDLDTATDRAPGRVSSTGVARPVPEGLAELFGQVPDWVEHESLTVDGVPVPWWVDERGVVHADTSVGLAHGLAWTHDRWSWRHAAVAALSGQGRPGPALLVAGFTSPAPVVHE